MEFTRKRETRQSKNTFTLSALPEDIIDEVFTYLDDQDLLNISLVSKNWNEMLARSSVAMKKLTVSYKKYSNPRKYLSSLLESIRPYQNFIINPRSAYCIFMDNKEIRNNIQAILKKFAGSIVSLDTTTDLRTMPEFPKLKKVTVRRNDYRNTWTLCVKGIMSRCRYIEELNVHAGLDSKQHKVIQNALSTMENLKILRCEGHTFSLSKLKNSRFSLTTLDFSRTLEYNDLDLLELHRATLTSLSIDIPICKFYLNILLTRFPNLRSLTFKQCFRFDRDLTGLAANESIKTLKFMMSDTLELIQNVSSKVTSLENLFVDMVTRDIFEYILSIRGLKQFEYNFFKFDRTGGEQELIDKSNIKFVQIPYVSWLDENDCEDDDLFLY